MPTVYEWPTDWYIFARSSFRLQARSQVTPRTWIGGKSVYGPHAQLWICKLTVAVQQWDDAGQWMAAFFSRLDGQAGLMRIGDPARQMVQYNRFNPSTIGAWSDSTFFNDGSGWATGTVPDLGFVNAAGSIGDSNLTISGLPVSKTRILRRGDLIEVRPGGIANEQPNLYEVQADADSSAGVSPSLGGSCTIEIRPRLRTNLVVGDQVRFTNATSVFRLVDEDQGAAEISPPTLSDLSFNLVEAIV